jgi:toxin YoeB
MRPTPRSQVRNLKFTDEAWADYVYWQTQDHKTLRRLNQLIEAAARTPFEGMGKPEPLKGNLAGCWSRRIDEQNRLVYQVSTDDLVVISCRYHYR